MAAHPIRHRPPLTSIPRSCRPEPTGRSLRACFNRLTCHSSENSQAEGAVPTTGWLWDSGAAETQSRLQAEKIRPKKSLGQNFVTDDYVLDRIVRASKVQLGDSVIEVGPGTGNLTKHLLSAGAFVTAVEKDHVLADRLQGEFRDIENLVVRQGDILRTDLTQLIDGFPAATAGDGGGTDAQTTERQRPIKVVANLPYYLTTDLLMKLLPMGERISSVHVMIQDEVAHRLCGTKQGGPNYRSMSIRCQYYSTPKYQFLISRQLYFPVPKVDGALVSFVLKTPRERLALSGGDDRDFMDMVRVAFLQRRKMLKNALQVKYEPQRLRKAFQSTGLNIKSRPQDLTADDFVRLYNAIAEAGHDGEPEEAEEEPRQRGADTAAQ